MRVQVLDYFWFPFYLIMAANNYGLFYWNLEDVPFVFTNDLEDEIKNILIEFMNNTKLGKATSTLKEKIKI